MIQYVHFLFFNLLIFLILMALFVMYLICQCLRCSQELENQNNAVSGQSIELDSTIQIDPVSSLGQSVLQIVQHQRHLTDFERGDRLPLEGYLPRSNIGTILFPGTRAYN